MIENIFSILALIVLGSCFGSFLSVLILRLNKKQKGIVTGHSECPHCHHQLKTKNLIPIISFIWQKGRCSYCKKQISIFYPLIELITALALSSNYLVYINQQNTATLFNNPIFTNLGSSVIFSVALIYSSTILLTLIAIAFSDLKFQKIPNLFLYFWVILGLIKILVLPIDLWLLEGGASLLVALIFYGGQSFLSKEKWLGWGDVWLAAGAALLLGFGGFLLSIVITYLIGGLIASILLISKKATGKTAIAFTPIMILGILISFYFGPAIINWYLNFTLF